MSDAKKCDRCGAFYEQKCNPKIVVTMDYHYQGKLIFDLCPKCREELKKWLNLQNKEEK